jgi:hypothetical protein
VKSWRDEDLVMFLYGEHREADELRRALERSPELATRLAEIARTLELAGAAPVAEPPADYETRVWARLRPALETRAPRRSFDLLPSFRAGGTTWRLAALAATLAATIGAAYLAGRASVKADPARVAAGQLPPSAFSSEERERLLLASVGDHLGSSSLLLTDLANAPSASAVGEERAWAETLLAGNRLYRQAAQRAGQRRIVALLDELEPLLLELAHAPAGATMNDLQHQLEERDLLFKVRVFASRLETGNAERARPSRAL